jgi:hypothetical protein
MVKRWAVIAVLVAACGGTIRKAEDAYDRGDYLAAAELYDKAVAEDPNNEEARAEREKARRSALKSLLEQSETAWRTNRTQVAIEALRRLLDHRDRWQMIMDPALAPRLQTAVTAAGEAISVASGGRLRAGGPLSAEAFVAAHAELLAHADFQGRGEEIRAEVMEAGLAACRALVPSATTPYWTWLVDRYCRHWGGAPLDVPLLPHAIGDATITGVISGAVDSQVSMFHTELANTVRSSVWYSPRATPIAGTIRGELEATFDSRVASMSADWSESVPYTSYETTQESYQEPYDDTEYYTEQVPTTEYRTHSVPCGETTCTETVPETVYHSESKSRTVTKYRTAYRDVTNPVTRYRDEPRVFQYTAIQQMAHYQGEVRVDLPTLGVFAFVTTDFTDDGYDHDVSFAEAGVSPSRANLMTLDGLAARDRGRLVEQLAKELDTTYAQRYCSAATFTRETAAQCALRGVDRMPAAAHTALREVFGADEALLQAL